MYKHGEKLYEQHETEENQYYQTWKCQRNNWLTSSTVPQITTKYHNPVYRLVPIPFNRPVFFYRFTNQCNNQVCNLINTCISKYHNPVYKLLPPPVLHPSTKSDKLVPCWVLHHLEQNVNKRAPVHFKTYMLLLQKWSFVHYLLTNGEFSTHLHDC